MATLIPVSGAFGEISARFFEPALGITVGWNYFIQWLFTLREFYLKINVP